MGAARASGGASRACRDERSGEPTVSLQPREHHIRVRRTARWYELGEATPAVREIWLVIHGYAQLARDFIAAFEPIAAAERLIVAPEALSRFYTAVERGGAHQRASVGATWMTREDREAEILDYVDYLDAVVERIQAAAPNASRTVALGFSQGTATASRWALLGASAPHRLILWGGGPAEDIQPEQLAGRFPALPIELVHGTEDHVVPIAIVQRAAERLRAHGVAIEMRTFEGGHRIDPAVLVEVASA
jgi:predicted esterase